MYSTEEVVQLVIDDLLEAETCLQDDPIKDIVPYMIRTSTATGDIVDKAAKDAMDKYVARMNLYSVKAMLAALIRLAVNTELPSARPKR